MKEEILVYHEIKLTIPQSLYLQVMEEAGARNMDFEAYIQAVLAGIVRPADCFLPLLIEAVCLREAVAADGVDADVRKAVLKSCRRIERFCNIRSAG